jgi:hypothetical protein
VPGLVWDGLGDWDWEAISRGDEEGRGKKEGEEGVVGSRASLLGGNCEGGVVSGMEMWS